MGYVLARVAGLAAAALVLLLTGTLADRLSGGRWPLPAPRQVGRILLGLLLATAYLFALAAGGALSLPALSAGVAGVASAYLLLGWRRGFAGDWRWRSPAAATGAERLLAGAVTLLFAGLLLEALNPYPAWDAQVYHLTLPRLWIEAGGFVRVPFNVYSNWPANFQLAFAAAMLAGDYLVATLLHWGAAVLLVIVLWRGGRGVSNGVDGAGGTGRAIGGPIGGAMAALLLLANDLVLFEARAAYVDLAAALALLVAYLLAEEGLERGAEARHLVAAGVAVGYLAGLKPNGVLGAAALVVAVALVEARRAGAVRSLRAAALLALPAFALLAPWLWRNAAQTGNPFYPFLFERFGGPEWSAELSRRLAAWQRGIGMGREPIDYLLLPWRAVVSGGEGYARFDGRLGLQWLAALPLALVCARERRVGRPLAVAALAFLLWAASAQQLRFLLPALALVALAAGRAVDLALVRLPARGRRLVVGAAALLALTALVPPAARELATAPTLIRRFLAHGEGVLAMAVPPPYRALAELTAPDARVVLVNSSQTFFCPRVCLADSFFEASQLAAELAGPGSAGAVRERLAALGATHLLLDARSRGIDWPPGLAALLADTRLAAPLWSSPDGRFALLELR